MSNTHGPTDQVIFWHRNLPPADADAVGEHTVEAASERVSGRLAHGDAMWGTCYESLLRELDGRIRQELTRLGGHYAHIRGESIDSKHDMHTDQGWLHGRFDYVIYKKP